jgi:DNA repair exonuclease SbcCD ATPase subunit
MGGDTILPMPERAKAHKGFPIWLAVVLVCAVIGAGGVVTLWQTRIIYSLQAQLAARAAENADLKRRVDQLTRAQVRNPPALPEPSAPRLAHPDPGTAAAAALTASEQRAEHLRESLAQTTAEMDRLRSRVSDLQGQVESAAADNRRLSAAAEESKKGLAEADQAIETLRAELKANNARAVQLDSLNSKMKEEAAAGKQSSSQIQQIVSDLDGIFRRREMYLNNMLRRYREITEQYRAMSGVIGSRDRETAAVGSAEISRIQNSIALAEEDLKQVSALNAQASRLEKKLLAR